MLGIESSWSQLPDSTLQVIGEQTEAHILWRNAFFKAVGETPSSNNFLSRAHAVANVKGTKNEKSKMKKTVKKSHKKPIKSRKLILRNKKEKLPLKENEIKGKGNGKGKSESTARRRRNSILKKSANKKTKNSESGNGRRGRKGKILNAEKMKSAKKDEL